MHASTVDRRSLYRDGAIDASDPTASEPEGPYAWMDRSACRDADPELFFPKVGGKTKAAKRICAVCPVQAECDAFVQATQPGREDDHGVFAGKNPRQRLTARSAKRTATARPAASPPAPSKPTAGPPQGSRFYHDRSAAAEAWDLAKRVGINEAARRLGVGTATLYRAWRRWDLGIPDTSRSAARWERQLGSANRQTTFRALNHRDFALARARHFYHDRMAAAEAWDLAKRVGINEAARRLGVGTGVGTATLYRAWRRWGLGAPDAPQSAGRSEGQEGRQPGLRLLSGRRIAS
jgi:WhiB family transcriptional regulator, redox-sensing transcriptional regulator